MDESFLSQALHAMGEENIVSIKVMRNKVTGEAANYGFINFGNDYSALVAISWNFSLFVTADKG